MTPLKFGSQSARDAQAQGYDESYCLYLEQSAFEHHGYYRAKGDFKTADEMLTRSLPECLIGNDGN